MVCTILASILAILTVGVVAVAVTYYMLKEPPGKELAKQAKTTKKTTPATTTKSTTTKLRLIPKLKKLFWNIRCRGATTTTWAPPLICTYNIQKFSRQSELPSDGICDQIYLDSLCRSPPCSPGTQWAPTGVVTDFLDVARIARTSKNKTRLGLAFDAHASNGLSIFAAEDNRKNISEELWNKYNCSHYASLDLNIRSFNSPEMAAKQWNPLLILGTQLANLGGVQGDFGLVLGVTSTDIPNFIDRVIGDYKIDPPKWTHFVIISHTSFANYALPPYDNKTSFDLTNCHIVPPTIYNYSSHYNETYYTSLEDSLDFLKHLQKASKKVPIAVSVTLKGRWFTPIAPVDRNLDLYKKCVKFDEFVDAPPYSVCLSNIQGSYGFFRSLKSGFFDNQTHAFTFDTEQSLKAKMCAFKEGALDLKFGIAVYDIDADVSSTPCRDAEYKGQYNRLKLLRKLTDYMDTYTNKRDCERVS